jgi:hypothetical protein
MALIAAENIPEGKAKEIINGCDIEVSVTRRASENVKQ